jgi:drug/metabolite transporter (DMT)-like permease
MAPLVPPFEYAGEILSLTAALLWSISLTIFTKFGQNIPSHTLNLFKNLFALSSIIVAISFSNPEWVFDRYIWYELGLSGIIGLSLGDTALFAALKRLGAQITAATQCLAPPISAFIAVVFLNENLTPREWTGLLITITSVASVIFFKKGDNSSQKQVRNVVVAGAIAAIFSAICQGTSIVLQRHAMQSIDVLLGTGIRIAPALIVLTIINFKKNSNKDGLKLIFRDSKALIYLSAASFMGTFLGLICQSYGTKYTKAAIAAALTSTYPLWIIPLAAIFLNEKISKSSVIGTFCAVGGIILLTF